jgi:hypothetical protein
MSLDATAQALVTDTAMSVDALEVTETTEAAEVSEDSEMSAVFDAMQDDDTPDEPEAVLEAEDAADAPDDDEAEDATDVEKVEAPSDVPYGIKQHWNDIPESARESILDSHREMGRKLADQGRQVQGIAPIRDVLTQAVKEIPSFADMRPDDAAAQIFELAKLSNDFTTNPVGSLMGYIQKHGLTEHMSHALAGQPLTGAVPNTSKEVERLTKEVARLSDPTHLRDTFETFNTQSQVQNSVTEFSQTAEHWGAVENHMPAAIQYVQATLGDDASPTDVLSKAYELAVSQFVPEAKVKQESASEKAAPIDDPKRSKAALKAKSANVQGRASGKSRTLTEDEQLSASFDKMQS